MITIIMILFAISFAFIISAATSLANLPNAPKYLVNWVDWFSIPAVFFGMFLLVIAFEYQKKDKITKKQEKPKYELIQEPVYRKIK